MINFEVGYTPNNLRLAITLLGMSQSTFADTLGVSTRTVVQWVVVDLNAKRHADMPLKQWRKVMTLLATANVV